METSVFIWKHQKKRKEQLFICKWVIYTNILVVLLTFTNIIQWKNLVSLMGHYGIMVYHRINHTKTVNV